MTFLRPGRGVKIVDTLARGNNWFNIQGNGRKPPIDYDRDMVEEVIGRRILQVANDPSLINIERWDQSDVFYAATTQFTHLGWNVSVYVKDRRMHVQELVRDVCDIAFGIKRHQIGLMPKERAAMAFNGSLYAVSFDNLRRLMGLGTDVVVIEKEGPTMKLIPHTKNVWIALIESQGFLVEYAIALAELCNGNWARAQTYTFDGKHSWVPRNKGNIGIISDWDYSGCMIGLQVRGAERIGIDFNTKDELNAMFSYPDLRIEDLEEPVNDHGGKGSTQWRGLVNLYNNGENDKNKLSLDEWAFYREYLSQRRDGVTYLEYLKSNRLK